MLCVRCMYFYIKMWSFISLQNIFNFLTTCSALGDICNFLSNENALSIFLTHIDSSLPLACISYIAENLVQRRGDLSLSVINYGRYSLTMFAALYQLWRSLTGWKTYQKLESLFCALKPIDSNTRHTATIGMLALASSIRRRGGLPFSIINYGRYNHHFCTVSVVKVLQTLENLMTQRLCL